MEVRQTFRMDLLYRVAQKNKNISKHIMQRDVLTFFGPTCIFCNYRFEASIEVRISRKSSTLTKASAHFQILSSEPVFGGC